MNPLDDLFRDGLAGRKAEVPDDLWERIAARQPGQVPAGEQLDQLFRGGLANRRAAVPAGFWARIQAARAPAAPHSGRQLALTALVFLLCGLLIYGVQTGLTDDTGEQSVVTTTTAPESAGDNERLAQPPVDSNLTAPEGDGAQVPGFHREEGEIASPTPPAVTATVPPREVGSADRSAPTAPEARPTTLTTTNLPGDRPEAVARPASPETVSARHLRPRPAAPSAVNLLPVSAVAAPPLSTTPPTLKRYSRVRSPGSFEPVGSNRLQGELLAGLGYTSQTLRANGPESQLLQEEREVTEFPQAARQLTARLRYRLSPRLRLLTGLTYGELRNRFEYDELVDGMPVLRQRNNRLRMVEVPAMLSYELPGRRLRLALNAGVTLNALTTVSGLYQDPTTLAPRSLDDSGFYRRSVGLGYTLSLTTAYSIAGGRLQLLLEPYFKTYPRSFTTGAAPVSEHYWTAGLQLGVRKPLR